MKKNVWISLIPLLALSGVLAIGQDMAVSAAKKQERTREEMPHVTVVLSQVTGMTTLVGGLDSGEPPWPQGNCRWLASKTNAQYGLPAGEWLLVNMHAENFRELVKRRGLESLELGLLRKDDQCGKDRCFVVDSRVPREWLRAGPCGACFTLEQRRSLMTRFAGLFRMNPQAESLVGTTWLLVRRSDPDGLIEKMLPGEQLDFGAVELTCSTAPGEARGRRSWELNGSNERCYLTVYNVQSTNAYTGAGLRLTREEDQMVLVPRTILSKSGNTGRSDLYEGAATVTYRIKR